MSVANYIDYVFLKHILSGSFDKQIGETWIPIEDMQSHFIGAMSAGLEKYGYKVGSRYDAVAQNHFDALVHSGAIEVEGDEFTGGYMRCAVNHKDAYAADQLKENEVAVRIDNLGPVALRRALQAIQQSEGWNTDEPEQPDRVADIDPALLLEKDEVPAADRVVRLDDNYSSRDEIIGKIDEISDAIRGENDEGGKLDGSRERIQAELRAGQELLKAPSARARALWAVLGSALLYVASEFAGGIIGELAVRLLELLRPLVGL